MGYIFSLPAKEISSDFLTLEVFETREWTKDWTTHVCGPTISLSPGACIEVCIC